MRSALIGLGSQGKKTYLPILQQSTTTQLVALCDQDCTKFEDIQCKCRLYSSYEELLDKEDLDFVVIATSHDAYPDIIAYAAKRGVHVLKEKPFARTLEEGLRFQEIAKMNQIILRTYPQRRFISSFEKIPSYLSQIGSPFLLNVQYTLFVEDPHAGWRGSRETAGGGCILDMGYHMIDALITHFGLPSNVCANFSTKAIEREDYTAEDTAVIQFSYPNSLYGSVLLSRYFPPKCEFIHAIGPQGIIKVSKHEISRSCSKGLLQERHIVPESENPFEKMIDHFCQLIEGHIPNDHHDQEQLEVLAFIQSCYDSKNFKKMIDPHLYLGNLICRN